MEENCIISQDDAKLLADKKIKINDIKYLDNYKDIQKERIKYWEEEFNMTHIVESDNLIMG